MFCLMQNEAAEAKVLAEIDAVVGDRVPSESSLWGSVMAVGVLLGCMQGSATSTAQWGAGACNGVSDTCCCGAWGALPPP